MCLSNLQVLRLPLFQTNYYNLIISLVQTVLAYMKNQEPETIQMTSVSETETIPINFKAFQPQKLLQASAQDARCSAKQRACLVCISKTCTSLEPFLCSNIQCSCQEIHEQCTKVNLRFITKKISQKILFSSNLKQQLESIFEKIIDQISELRDKVLQQIDTKIKYANLHKLENSFLKVLHSSSLKQHMQQGEMDALWKIITDKNPNKSDPFQKLTQKVNTLQTQVSQSSNSILQFIDEQSKRLEKHHALFEQSRLELCSSENIERLEGFFMKKIKEASCVFRASQNNFSTTQFYKNCGKMGSLMIVCRTNMEKIIGGYTPLEIGSDGADHYASDPSQQSFIFSLSNGDKFTMKTTNNAIYRVANQQRICFGGCQFQICNNANLVKKCRSYSLNYYYENPKYQANDKLSFMRFNGNSDQYFTVKEWEAWKVQFQN